MHQLDFPLRYRFTRTKDGITIPISLSRGSLFEKTTAKIDTGAEHCLFRREIGEALEIDIESGLPKTFATLTGSLTAFGHEVTLQSFDLTFQSMVYFAQEYELPRNLLGSIGWLRHLKLGLIDYDEILYLGPYSCSPVLASQCALICERAASAPSFPLMIRASFNWRSRSISESEAAAAGAGGNIVSTFENKV